MSRTTILGDLNPLIDTETGSETDTRDFATHPRKPKSPKSNYKTPGRKVGSPVSHPRKLSSPRESAQKSPKQTSPRKGVKFVDVATDSGTATDPNATTGDSESETSLDVLLRNIKTPPSSRSSSHKSSSGLRRSSRSSGRRGSTRSSKTSPPSSQRGPPRRPAYGSETDEEGGGTGNEENNNPDETERLKKKTLTTDSRAGRTMKEAAIAFAKLQRVRSGRVGTKYGNINPSRKDVNKTLAANLALLLPRTSVKKPAKKPTKPEDTVHPTQSINLSEEVPEPVRKLYPPHPLEDRPNEFYRYKFYDLYKEIADWANIYFGHPDLEKTEWLEIVSESVTVWSLVDEMPEFVQWAEMVAEEDPAMGGWDWILKVGVSRKWLVAAVLAKIIKQKVFDELLFGGNKEEKEMIFAVEAAMFQREGFQRQNLRAKQARAVIMNRPVTSEFYADVGTHTAQTFQLLKPLIDFLYSLPAKNGMVLPPSTLLYQDLHNIFSNAGYLALCVRLSPTIFWWQEVRPGENFNSEEQTNVDHAAWKESKDNQVMPHTKNYNEWKRKHDSATRNHREYWAAEAHETPAGIKAKEKVAKLMEEKPDYISNIFRAKAKIAIWPSIKRFKEGSHKDDKKDIPIWQKRGMREFPINCAMVLCYYCQVKADVNEPPLPPKQLLSEYLMAGGKGAPVLKFAGSGVNRMGSGTIAALSTVVVGGAGLDYAINGGELTRTFGAVAGNMLGSLAALKP